MQEQNLLTGLEKLNKFLDRMPYLGIPKVSEKGSFSKHAWMFKEYPSKDTILQPERFKNKRDYVSWMKQTMTERFITGLTADIVAFDMRDFSCDRGGSGEFIFFGEGFDLDELPSFVGYYVGDGGELEGLNPVLENKPKNRKLFCTSPYDDLEYPVGVQNILPDLPNTTNKKYKIIFLQDGYLTNFSYSEKETDMVSTTAITPITPNISMSNGFSEIKVKSPAVEFKAYDSLFSITKLKDGLGERMAYLFPAFSVSCTKNGLTLYKNGLTLYFIQGKGDYEHSISILDGAIAKSPEDAISRMVLEFLHVDNTFVHDTRFYECLVELVSLENSLLKLKEANLFAKEKELDVYIAVSQISGKLSYAFLDNLTSKLKKFDDMRLEGKLTNEQAIELIEKMILKTKLEVETYIHNFHTNLLLEEAGIKF